MSKFFALALVLVFFGGAILWFVAYQPQLPQFSFAQSGNTDEASQEIRSEVRRIDQQLAEKIREFGENGINWDEITSPPQVASSFEKVSQASISATMSTTPEELWRTLREEGSQAVLGSLAKNAEVSINSVSTEVMNEARYQYCLGVVEQYKQSQ